ncbi:MAG: SH3 domain-containing protein [Cyanobacteria bacterium P01_F01_bin.86]
MFSQKLIILAITVLGVTLVSLSKATAAETCPIFDAVNEQYDDVPTLTPWLLEDTPTGAIKTIDPDSRVNVRSGAGTDFSVVFQSRPGDTVTLISHALSRNCTTWFRLEFLNGRTGWVRKDFVGSDRGFGLFN